MGISYIEMNEQKIPIEDEELREVVSGMQGDIDVLKGTVGYTSPNRLPYPYVDTTKTVVGVTYTDVGDGTISTSGTGTSANSFTLAHKNVSAITYKKGKYILSGCAKGGSDDTYFITLNADINGVSTNIAKDYGEGTAFELEEDATINYINIAIASGVNVDGLLFKPMIVPASLGKIPFEPYVADVQTQIDNIGQIVINENLKATSTATYPATIKTYSNLPKGKYVMTFRALGVGNSYMIGTIKKNGIEIAVASSFSNVSGVSAQASVSSIFEIENSTDTIAVAVQSGVALTDRDGQYVKIMKIA